MKWLIPFALVTLLGLPPRTWNLQADVMNVQADAQDADEGRMIVMKDSFKAITGPSSVGVVEQPSRPRESYLATITAYSKHETCPQKECITASGKVVQKGFIACPRRFVFGTRITIADIDDFVCEDRTALYLDGWDIWMGDTEEDWQAAIQFGQQTKQVVILE